MVKPPKSSVISGEFSAALYAELRSVAARHLRRERRNHTLRPTDLAHEAFLRLARTATPGDSHVAFRAAAAQAIRHILVEHARRRARRGSPAGAPLQIEPGVPRVLAPAVDLLDLDDALDRLEQLSPRQARVVELRFFGGLSEEQAAETLGIARRTVQKDWRGARAWLLRELSGRAPGPERNASTRARRSPGARPGAGESEGGAG